MASNAAHKTTSDDPILQWVTFHLAVKLMALM